MACESPRGHHDGGGRPTHHTSQRAWRGQALHSGHQSSPGTRDGSRASEDAAAGAGTSKGHCKPKRQCHKNLHVFPSAMKSETQEEKELSHTTKLIFLLAHLSHSVYIPLYILYRPLYTLKKLKALTKAPKPHRSPHPGEAGHQGTPAPPQPWPAGSQTWKSPLCTLYRGWKNGPGDGTSLYKAVFILQPGDGSQRLQRPGPGAPCSPAPGVTAGTSAPSSSRPVPAPHALSPHWVHI